MPERVRIYDTMIRCPLMNGKPCIASTLYPGVVLTTIRKDYAHVSKLAMLSIREGFIDSVKKANRNHPTTLRRL